MIARRWLLGAALAALVVLPAQAGLRVAVLEGVRCGTQSPLIDAKAVRAALSGGQVTLLGAIPPGDLAVESIDVLVVAGGAGFPRLWWGAIESYLAAGGNLVHVGGTPFAAPAGAGACEPPRTAYFKTLGLVQSFDVDVRGMTFAPLEGFPAGYAGERAAALSVRFASTKSRPGEDGSDGPREARLTPLVHARDARGVVRAAPVVAIDHLAGRFSGGRWVFDTGSRAPSPALLRAMVESAGEGASGFTVVPRYAGFHPGEAPELAVTLLRPERGVGTAAPHARVEVRDARGTVATALQVALRLDGDAARGTIDLPADLPRGLYEVRVTLDTKPRALLATSGFWVYDAAMLAGGHVLGAGRDYLTRDGAPLVITGTTYMASDVHRRFLVEPNAWLWERDFAAMAAAGVNLVRTGIWTGWRELSDGVGRPREAALRAAEVFLLTARRHDIPVVFTLFAFLPEAWGAENPYLDPRAAAAQAAFATGFAARMAGARDIAWDLINEPSFSSPKRLWQCRPNYDKHELAAWRAWLRDVAPADGTIAPYDALSARWGVPVTAAPELPGLDDFEDRNLYGDARPVRALDYRRFAQAAFADWARALGASIRAAGRADWLVTVGQDEGGTVERPNPLYFADAVSLTTNHTWWWNDALLWDALAVKSPGKPSLVEETGLMNTERTDGRAWRGESEARDLLERKLVLALGGGSAGFVQWLWNINVTMPSDNEAGIGFVRDDGSVRPEREPFEGLARFAAKHAAWFAGREDEPVAVVVPETALLGTRGAAATATQRAVRTLEYELRVPVRLVAERDLARALGAPRLAVLPLARELGAAAREALEAARGRGTLLVATSDDVAGCAPRPVGPAEELALGERTWSVPYRGDKLERVETCAADGTARAETGERRLTTALPLELSDDPAPLRALYAAALDQAHVAPAVVIAEPPEPSLLVRPLVLERAVLVAVVNEGPVERTVHVGAQRVAVRVPARRAALLLLDRAGGAEIGRYAPGE